MTGQDAPVTVSVRNLGGIDAGEVSLGEGVTVLTGRNATNRTSFLRALSAALGGSAGELKRDADEGRVELSADGETYTRRFERRDGRVSVTGDPYTAESSLVDAFSCLLATNDAREAAERGDGDALREVIMRPVDTAEIRASIDRHQREVRSLTDRIEDLDADIDRLPDVREELAERREEREAVTDELEEVRTAVADSNDDADAVEAAEDVVDDLTDTREEYERVRDRLETQRAALQSLEDEREAVAADLSETAAPEDELAAAKDELERLQSRRRELENAVNSLVSVVEFNERMVDDAPTAVDAGDDDASADPLAGLDPSGETVECWTCGTTVQRAAVETRLDDLRAVIDEKRSERNELRTAISEQRDRVAELRSTVQDHQALSAELDDIDEEIDDRESRVADLEERAEDLRERIDDLEARAAETEGLRDSDLLERYRRLSELEYERGQLDERVDSLAEAVQSIEDAREERERLAAEREDHREALSELRSRIADLEREAVETFNDHMETLLSVLGYENVERVWIERRTAGGGDDPAPESSFDLHVVRSTPDGAVYEDTVTHLSESEREVIGLVVALAGYLVHDVHETMPFVLLDSLEAIDAERIAALVEYFADYADYLVVALLDEDAQALADRHDRIVMDAAVA